MNFPKIRPFATRVLVLPPLILGLAAPAGAAPFTTAPSASSRALETALKSLPALDASALPPTEKRWDSPERIARHRVVMDELWRTTLAQMYLAYLTDRSPPPLVPGRAKYVVEQIFADGQHAGKRLKLIVHLTADLYARDVVTPDMVTRMVMFDTLIISRKIDGEDGGNSQMFSYALAALLLSAPLASSQVAEEVGKIRNWVSRRCVGGSCGHRVNWSVFRDVRGMVRQYDPEAHFLTYLSVGGGGLFLYGITRQQMPGFLRGFDKDEKMLNGRDALIEQAEY